jgi:hypothetical protein
VADVLILFCAALIAIVAGIVTVLIVRDGRARRRLAARERPFQLERDLAASDDYLRRVSQVTTEAELNRLENERKHR